MRLNRLKETIFQEQVPPSFGGLYFHSCPRSVVIRMSLFELTSAEVMCFLAPGGWGIFLGVRALDALWCESESDEIPPPLPPPPPPPPPVLLRREGPPSEGMPRSSFDRRKMSTFPRTMREASPLAASVEMVAREVGCMREGEEGEKVGERLAGDGVAVGEDESGGGKLLLMGDEEIGICDAEKVDVGVEMGCLSFMRETLRGRWEPKPNRNTSFLSVAQMEWMLPAAILVMTEFTHTT